METKIEFKDVISFIKKAMNDGLEITEEFNRMCIYNNNNEDFRFYILDKRLYITTPKGYFSIEISDKEVNIYNVIIDNVRDYIHDIGVKEFIDFFKDEESPVKDINDLDNDED